MVWSQFIQATCLPATCGCEFIHFGEWIRQPANFWSSLFYVVLSVLIWAQSKTFYQKFWSVLCFILGISSHLAHASFIQLAMSADFASIITLMVFPVLMQFSQHLTRVVNILLVALFYFFIFCVMFFLGKVAKITICLAIFSGVLWYHLKFLREALRSALFIKTLILLFAGFSFFILDEGKVFCDPHSWFQLHSLWHLLTALALYYYSKWIFNSGKW